LSNEGRGVYYLTENQKKFAENVNFLLARRCSDVLHVIAQEEAISMMGCFEKRQGFV
jgi:hypothetical protein